NAAALDNQGRYPEALRLYGALVKQFPANAQLLENYADVLFRAGRLRECLNAFNRSLALGNEQARLYCNRGIALRKLDRPQQAVESYDRAIALNPGLAVAHYNRANALLELRRFAEDVTSFDAALLRHPAYAEAYHNRGVSLKELGRFQEALDSYDRAVALQPDHAEAYCNRGVVLKELDRYREALHSYDRAIAVRPGYASAYCNRGSVLQELEQFGEAVACYQIAITNDPDLVETYWNLALLHLLTGNYREGWALYEWRFKHKSLNIPLRAYAETRYSGQAVKDKTVLLYAEQGLGDTLQFCRYAGLLADRGARVILEAQPVLASLLETLDARIEVLPAGSKIPGFDYYSPLLSLPYLFKTGLDTIPAAPAYLRADPGKSGAWRRRLGEKRLPRVGLVWSGSMEHKQDHKRSIPLASFAGMLNLPFEFHCLQQEIREDDLSFCRNRANLKLHDPLLTDFAETAALAEQMDLVISVDTAVAHLAGALGKPLWLLLPFIPDFRWLLERGDTPWYPSATLFRQDASRDWSAVLGRMILSLRAWPFER
ncbi:MAG: tetratricopeptide repeat-containing glycosyltransferase family protein, partial [Methylomonas sp.]